MWSSTRAPSQKIRSITSDLAVLTSVTAKFFTVDYPNSGLDLTRAELRELLSADTSSCDRGVESMAVPRADPTGYYQNAYRLEGRTHRALSTTIPLNSTDKPLLNVEVLVALDAGPELSAEQV
ncbi:hypothetical protein FRC06_010250 [Ceratobasidium sp. 370]|nr:hypothetical protein FRC06_010250 [Ceratobasidium sp. 370]